MGDLIDKFLPETQWVPVPNMSDNHFTNAWKPEDFILSLERLNPYRGPVLEISYHNGDKYHGQVKKGRKHGEGELK